MSFGTEAWRVVTARSDALTALRINYGITEGGRTMLPTIGSRAAQDRNNSPNAADVQHFERRQHLLGIRQIANDAPAG